MFSTNSTKPFITLLWGLLATMCLGACGGGEAVNVVPHAPAQQPARPTPTPVGLEMPAQGSIYLGAYTSMAQPLSNLESQIGRTFALDMSYYRWTANFPASRETSDFASGRIPVDSWNCGVSNAQIISGYADLLIATRAIAIKNFGHPIFLRYGWDMNQPTSVLSRGLCYDATTDNPDGTFSATEFTAAWQHIRQIFSQEQVNNVIWVWSPSASGSDPTSYYPGDAQVDWIGVDAYDPSGAGLAATLAPMYASVAKYNKPILVAESGELAGNQPAFFQAVVPTLQAQFPLVKGFMYYDANAGSQNWTLSQAGLTAFTMMAGNPYFAAMGAL